MTNFEIYLLLAGLFGFVYTIRYFRKSKPKNYYTLTKGQKKLIYVITFIMSSMIAPLLALELVIKLIKKLLKRGAKA